MHTFRKIAAALMLLSLLVGCGATLPADSVSSGGSADSTPSGDSAPSEESGAVNEGKPEASQSDTGEGYIVEIKTADDLRELSHAVNIRDSDYLKTTYLLMNDIDMAGEDFTPIGRFSAPGYHEPGVIGFNAIFDGQGYTIRNLEIRVTIEDPMSAYYTGLFASIGQDGQVKNLRIEDCDISFQTGGMDIIGGSAIGGLAGANYGAVINCSVSGKVTGAYQVGGLLGVAGWLSTVDGCSASVSVTGEAEIGALIGSMNNALITNCEAEGEVTAVNLPGLYDRPRAIGGFCGFMSMGTVRDCRSSVYVKTMDSSDWVGGFVGYNYGEIVNCLYDRGKAANWKPVCVEYPGTVSDVKDIVDD